MTNKVTANSGRIGRVRRSRWIQAAVFRDCDFVPVANVRRLD